MYDEPDVVKMLREEEKLGKFQDSLQAPSEELEIEKFPFFIRKSFIDLNHSL